MAHYIILKVLKPFSLMFQVKSYFFILSITEDVSFTGLKVVVPRGPNKAKGLLMACIKDKDPCIVFEPKTLYRAAVEEVPEASFECAIGKADILRSGNDITLIAWGTQVHVMKEVADLAKAKFNVNCEVIDLVSILPWDKEAVCNVSHSISVSKHDSFINIFNISQSVKKCGRVIIAHEAPLTSGFGAEIAATIQVS